MSAFKMQVKLIGPSGETIDAWTHEVPPEALYIRQGIDSQTPGKCYFRAVLLGNLARKITYEMLRWMQTRGWYGDVTEPEPEVSVTPSDEEESLAA